MHIQFSNTFSSENKPNILIESIFYIFQSFQNSKSDAQHSNPQNIKWPWWVQFHHSLVVPSSPTILVTQWDNQSTSGLVVYNTMGNVVVTRVRIINNYFGTYNTGNCVAYVKLNSFSLKTVYHNTTTVCSVN